jgi:uncharacterized BrkB/YihY/UPF0761 family membrane protein
MNELQKQKQFNRSIKIFLYTFVGTILPLIIAIFVVFLFDKQNALFNFLDKGEVLIFSVGLSSTAFLLFCENKDAIHINRDKFLYHFNILNGQQKRT